MADRIEITRGRSETLKLELQDADFQPYNLAGDEKIIFGVKKDPEKDSEYVFLKTATSGIDGVYKFEITPDDTENLEPGHYFFDVALQSGERYFSIIDKSRIYIEQNVTERGCAD